MDKIVTLSKLKAFAENKISLHVTQRVFFFFFFYSEDNILGKGVKASYHQFILFHQCFPKAFFFSGGNRCDCELSTK